MRCRLSPLVVLLALTAARGERWKMQYFYDVYQETFQIADFACPAARRCIAVGVIGSDQKKSARPSSVVTSDGGAHWTTVALKEEPLSLFFLDDSTGWMVGSKSLWKTQEGGLGWLRVGKVPSHILRVHFVNPQRGWAIGNRKSVFETRDGGKAWTPVAAAASPKTNPEHSAYTWIAFADTNNGMISGWSKPLRHPRSDLPDWVDPESAAARRQWPTLSLMLDTHDGGANWVASTASLFGSIARIRLLPSGTGFGLVTFDDNFEWASEVIRIDWKSGKSSSAFRDRSIAISDVALLGEKLAFIAGEELPGKLRQNPIPGKLKILRSTDLITWKADAPVDYRATARRAMLATADAANVWVATDTGMILKLEP